MENGLRELYIFLYKKIIVCFIQVLLYTSLLYFILDTSLLYTSFTGFVSFTVAHPISLMADDTLRSIKFASIL